MIIMASGLPYPVRVDASLQPRLSRWLWLVKWILAVPHFIVLALLWVAFAVLSVVAMVSILVTGRYPRAVFDFNVGVLRWHWRVAYYSYAAFGTDRYPPFTLAEVPDYPAHLQVAYPERLSRGLVLVKWWLLAIPHYLVVGVFAGGGLWLGWQADRHGAYHSGAGLISLLALVAVVVLAFTGRYPRPLFDFILGMDRWMLRVAAYAGLMTDEYPPFRLDMGGPEPGATLTLPPVDEPSPPPTGTGWSAGRVISVVAGAVLLAGSAGLFGAGGVGLWADQTQRQDGYLTTSVTSYHTGGYAVATAPVELRGAADSFLGGVRIRVTADGGTPVFIGVAPAGTVERYLAGVGYSTVTGPPTGSVRYIEHAGTAPRTPPGDAGIWAASVTGTGTQTLPWTPRDGRWIAVVMNADATPGVAVRAEAGARVAALPWIIVGVFGAGAIVLVAAAALIAVPLRRTRRGSGRG
jgi:Domain of unknown function (DUF4389)